MAWLRGWLMFCRESWLLPLTQSNSSSSLAEAGAHVVMAVRNMKAANELIQQWRTKWSASGTGHPLI
ncbi:hypothetical protein YC2023_022322 [Brassica napus]